MSTEPPLRRRIELFLAATACLILIAVADHFTGRDIASVVFYAAAIALAAWTTADLRFAVASAVIGGALWLAVAWWSRQTLDPGVVLWNAASRLAIFVGIAMLVWRLKNALDLAHALARTDYVTDILNARAFHETARIEISRARRYHHPLTVAYFDLDDFKSVNDRFGHTRGDAVLRQIAATLRGSLRESDTVARVGGDEFVVLLPETRHEQAQEALTKLQRALADAMRSIGNGVTVSIGATVFEVPPADVDALISAADAMMYKAKASGKNRICIGIATPAIEPLRGWRST